MGSADKRPGVQYSHADSSARTYQCESPTQRAHIPQHMWWSILSLSIFVRIFMDSWAKRAQTKSSQEQKSLQLHSLMASGEQKKISNAIHHQIEWILLWLECKWTIYNWKIVLRENKRIWGASCGAAEKVIQETFH